MRFEAFIASRYLRGKRKSRFVSLITLISVAGVSVGVMALIVVMSVMTGFDNELRAKIIGNRAHVTVMEWDGDEILDSQEVERQIKTLCPEIEGVSPFIEVLSLLKTLRGADGSQIVEFAYVVGVDPRKASDVTLLEENLSSKNGRTHGVGELPEYKEIVLGYILASKLGAYIDTPLMIVTPRLKSGTYVSRPTEMLVTVSGLSQAQMHEFDTVYGFITLETAKKLTGKEGVDGIQLRLDDPFKAKAISDRIEENMPSYKAVTWYESQQAFFEALKEEKVVMFIILLFIILVAAFNITSTLIMVVMEKRRDIGILRTIGVGSGSVLRLFILEGLYIGLTGTLVGLALGILLAYNLNAVAEFIAWMMGVDLFNSQIYYFDRIPVAIQWVDVMWVTVCAVLLTFLSTIYPAWSASRLDPVDALRYE
ncbi:MAG: lipoprotein-releasing ABC transporter permease subunit [Candidatus Hydrogenedentota bacterium]